MTTNFNERVINLLSSILDALANLTGGGSSGGGDEGNTPPDLHSGYLDVGTSPDTFPNVALSSITVRLGFDAIAPVFVGAGSVGVEQDYPLYPGDSVTLSVNNANELSCVAPIASYGSVRVFWIGS